ncbi:MAG: integrase core domain-containing protein, partial [Clostridia bacterium]|nr:integrase core domain-containing protein [Clostridia bacterium]
DNPIIESLNGWIKEELRIDFDIYHCKDVPALIENYIIYYNTERPSANCGRKSPVQFRTEQGF